MVGVRFATVEDAGAISNICSEAWRITYAELYSKEYIEKVIADFYNIDRIKKECQESSSRWHGYMVAVEENEVVGCIGGALLDFLTDYQKEQFSITSQEVHVTTGNRMGIPFYEKNGFQLIEVIPNWIDESEGTENLYRRQV